ncbi:flagellar hook-length control protein FliK [Agrobacterium sp. rho-8.1]|nr:flagellar hook-length control protein FliK [Agrobacterium sp. rho-8.1]
MNVLTTIASANSDATAQASRQGRDTSKGKGSGFSETLGSFDKAAPSRQSPRGDANAAKDDAQPQAVAEDTAVDAAPLTTPQPSTSKPIVPPPVFPVVVKAVATTTPENTVLPLVNADLTTEAPIVEQLPVATVPRQDISNDNALAPVMTDLAKLVTALTKTVSAPATSKTEGASKGDATDEIIDADAAPVGAVNENVDLLALLASTAMPTQPDQPQGQNVAPAQNANQTLGAVSGNIGTAPLVDGGPTTTSVVRLQKQDTPGIDFHFETDEDGSTQVDVAKAAGDAADVVQVVESRRFVGLAPATNAAAITSAMSSDPDWASSMAGQTNSGPMIASTGQVVHVLKIQMAPVDLGHVTAALKLVGDDLSVQLTAHTLKGYSELQKDSSSILDALKSQGFSVEQVTVSLASGADRQDNGTNNRQPSDGGQQSAQHNQRGQEEKPQQQQSYRQASGDARQEAIVHESTSTAETSVRASSARPDLVYL